MTANHRPLSGVQQLAADAYWCGGAVPGQPSVSGFQLSDVEGKLAAQVTSIMQRCEGHQARRVGTAPRIDTSAATSGSVVS